MWTRPNPCAEALVALGHACAQLKNAWAAIEKMPADARRAAIAAYELPRKGGAKSSIKIFSDDEEEILVSFCNMAAVTPWRSRAHPAVMHPPVTIAIATTKSDSDDGTG